MGSKKNEKGKRRTESPKRRQQGKRAKKTGEKANRSGRITKERQSGVNMTSCITKLIFYSRLNEKKASAISRQVKRIKGNDKIQDSKGNKKSDFNSTKERLLSALGGNASNPSCGGQPFNASSSKSTSGARGFSQDTLATLIACETEIADKCGNPTTGNASKLAELEACETLANDFKSAFSKCFAASKTLEESCTCVEAISEEDVASLQKCDVSSDNSAALKAKKACKSAVGKCKTAEAAAVEGIDTCKQETKCFGVAEGSRLVAEVLTPLNEALKNPAFSNALKTAGLDTGAGADGQVPSSSRQVLPSYRQGGDGAGCTAVDEEWTKFNITGNKALASADGSIDEASANETTEILNRINARSTLVEDLQSCANETSGRQVAVAFTIIRIRIYEFWAQWWRQTIVETKICSIATTFNISTSTVDCGTGGSSATTIGAAASSTITSDSTVAQKPSTAATATTPSSTIAGSTSAAASTLPVSPISSTTSTGDSTVIGGSTTLSATSAGSTSAAATTSAGSLSATSAASTAAGSSTDGGTTVGGTTAAGSSTAAGSTGAATSTAAASTTVAASTTAAATTTGTCANGWTLQGTQCYILIQSETATYPAAKAACAQYGTDGLLAAPVTSEIQGVLDSLNAAGTPADFWIGLDDMATEETYTFSDGTSFTKTGGTYAAGDVTWSAPFTSWKDNQPKDDETNRELQDCVRTDENGKWDDLHCTNTQINYACQIPVGNPVSPVCGASWSKIDDMCYKLISITDTDVTEVTQAANEVDYANAKASCEGLATDGKLAGPKTTTIFDELNALNTGSLEYWVGLDDSTTEGTYTFSDGTSFTLTGGTIGT